MEPVSRKFIPKKLFFDKRLIDRNLRDGIVSAEEYTTYLERLPDRAEITSKMEIQANSTVSQGSDPTSSD